MSSKITVQTALSIQSKKTRHLTFNDLEIGDVFEWDNHPNELCMKCTKKHYRWLTTGPATAVMETETAMETATGMATATATRPATEMATGMRRGMEMRRGMDPETETVIRYDLTLVKSNPVSEIECD